MFFKHCRPNWSLNLRVADIRHRQLGVYFVEKLGSEAWPKFVRSLGGSQIGCPEGVATRDGDSPPTLCFRLAYSSLSAVGRIVVRLQKCCGREKEFFNRIDQLPTLLAGTRYLPHVTQQPRLKQTAAQSAATKTRPLCNEVTGAPKYGPRFRERATCNNQRRKLDRWPWLLSSPSAPALYQGPVLQTYS